MHNIKLIAFDLDGTLLTSDKRLTEENAAALQKAAEAGIEIVPATGRFYKGMPEIIRNLPYVRYVITINGAQVYDVKEDRTVCGSELPWERAVALMERLDTLPVIYDCYQDGWGWMTQALYDQAEEYAANPHSLDMILHLRTPVPDLKECLASRQRGVQKVQAFFQDMDLRAQMLKILPEEFPDMKVTSSIVNNIEVNSQEANKGNALRLLSEHLGIPLSQTMAFGDDLNDIDMLSVAGIGVAMANAYAEVKAVADRLTDDCDHSGVGRAINEILMER
ncbi:MAG: HAD family phosphatase [Lachnospiraceae bacterium]|nr:HAD family phosphatase [Lachnospiraceae bacterium]